MTIKEMPKNHGRYVVATLENGDFIYYGSSPFEEAAKNVADQVGGYIIEVSENE